MHSRILGPFVHPRVDPVTAEAMSETQSGRAVILNRPLFDLVVMAGLRSVLTAACVLSASAAAIAAPVLRSADLQITVTSPTSCDVAMALAVDGVSEIEHRIEAFEGSRIELVGIRGARQVGDVRAIGRTQSLLLRPDQAAYGFHYRAVQPAPRLHRCPIWLPTVPTEGRSRPVRLQIDLPPATVAGTLDAGVHLDGRAWCGHTRPPSSVRARAVHTGRRGAPVGNRLGDGRVGDCRVRGRDCRVDVARSAIANMGFGASFYGFFIAAAIWLLVYFLWAFKAAARDRSGARR